ncbi:amino acid/amide ABC transporter membrane protein 2, HAAT family [Chitinophaga jiangningensis]|uniref:Amino acid/amide ABC transporter membrane protein 2, HAAT family n=1 Tax=Chitinophaga jiangningensis TaxID=1419482 RepID=A0A1M7CKF2_9BACT|nr:urea ABC transporter permease subunit UrtC [Chitinophaga jiangningensis]SHL67714.1 amino acid/amide ABC transporter membrane protein 2, HAAT family [Chitinophaga jiangningensis]
MKTNNSSLYYILFIAIFAILLPAGHLSGFLSINTISIWGRYFCFAIAALGIDLIWGYTGILSMCQAFFFCLGSYGIAMHLVLQKTALPDFMVWNKITTLPFFWQPFNSFSLTVILCMLIPAALAFLIGFVLFKSRIKGVYMAIITQALTLAMWLIFLRNETNLGGTNGLTDFKTLLGFDLANTQVKLALYFISFTVLCLAYMACHRITRSKFGKVLQAIRDSESRVSYTAYHTVNFKLAVFVVAALLAAVGGMLYLPQTGIITPGRMDVKASVEMVMWVALGGRGNLKGAVIGALLVNFLYSVCTSWFPDSWLFILGFLFVITVLYFDKGLIGLVTTLRARIGNLYLKTAQTTN